MKNKIIASIITVFLAFTPAAVLAEEIDAEVLMIEESCTESEEVYDDEVVVTDEFVIAVEEVETKIYDASAYELVLDYVVIEELDEAGLASDAAPAEFSLFGNVVYSDSYGAQLTAESKVIYDAMVTAYIANRTAGQPTISLDEHELLTFSLEAYKNGDDLASDKNLQEALENLKYIMQPAYNAFVYDYPEAAWIRSMNYAPSVEYLLQDNGEYEAEDGSWLARLSAVKLIPVDCYSGASSEIAAFDQAVNAAVEKISAGFSDDTSLESMIKDIHDYLCDIIVYTDLKSDTDKSDHSAAGVFLKNGKVVCEGYAKAFKILCRKFNIESVLIPGYATGAHMWNYVKMEDGNWYLIDVTWDDGTLVDYEYFLKGSNSVSRTVYTNFSNSQYTQNFVLPYLSSQDYSAGIHLHTWEIVSETAATCIAYGSRIYKCTDSECGASVTETIGIDAHKWLMMEAVSNGDATCLKNGTKTVICSVCGESGKMTDTGSMLPHKIAYISNNDATCLNDGTKTPYCEYGCGTEFEVIQDEGSKLDHLLSYTSNNDATCISDGTKTPHCEYGCGTEFDVIQDEGSKLDHLLSYRSNNDATCLSDGTKTPYCEYGCGTVFASVKEENTQIPHLFQYVSNDDATCMSDGTKTQVCVYDCGTKGETIVDEGTQIDHKFEYISNNDATCSQNGTKTQVCTYGCGTKGETIVDTESTGHSFTQYKYNGDATVLTDGTKTACCERGCGVSNTITASGTKLKPTYKVTAKNIKLKVGQSTSKIKITDLAAGDSVKSWVSSNKNVVTVSKAGKIKGIKKGTAYVTVTLVSKEKIKIKVTVQKSAVKTTAITGLKKNLTIKKGKKETLTPVLKPITSVETITYTTSNKKVAAVSKKGIITAKAAGKAKITVKAGTKKFVVTVTVPQTKTTGIKNIPKTVSLNLKKKKTYQLKAKILPANSDQKITYSTSKKSVASVSKTGKITAKKKGTTIIKVKSGSKTVECRVTVK